MRSLRSIATDTASRSDLGTLIRHVQDTFDRLHGEAAVQLAAAMSALVTPDGELRVDDLSQAEADALWAILDDIATDNGLFWDIADGSDD
ncbi:hypothetical protein ACRDU6_27490 [Mycolicibacterium sp. ELW1]|uniref:hypothetical protein n=1 Tax=Mycobacteriaceae TaxID=1762 RepID=UPI0011ECFD34|nr:hypothetical protein [Mycobacterium sp. ELW1]QEN15936.1 hypothetical protein D3H54_24000 [Mycobacterium sp. ELW1]